MLSICLTFYLRYEVNKFNDRLIFSLIILVGLIEIVHISIYLYIYIYIYILIIKSLSVLYVISLAIFKESGQGLIYIDIDFVLIILLFPFAWMISPLLLGYWLIK